MKGFNFFYRNPGHFKVIYAGRYLSKSPNPSNRRPRPLSDFDFDAIRATVRTSRNWVNSFTDSASAHVLYLTGGHPLCISKALCMDIFQPSHLISNSNEVYTLINLVAESIEFELLSRKPWSFPILQACSVFRKITLDILKKLKDDLFKLYDVHEMEVEDELKFSYLWTLKPNINALGDGITRRVLSINLRNAAPDKYRKYCVFAQEICLVGIKTIGKLQHHSWFIEFLFQSLQLHALEINNSSKRQKIIDRFYSASGDFNKGVEEYKKTFQKSLLAREMEMLEEEINEDKEFQFMVNYYLRGNDDEYNNAPIKELKRKVKEEFQKQ